MDRKYTFAGYFGLIAIFLLILLQLNLQAPPEAKAQPHARADITGTPEGYLPIIAKQPTITPTPTATPTPTRTPTPTPASETGIFCSYGPFAEFGFLDTNSVTDTLSIETTGTIMDLDLYLNVTHTFVGDLIADLTHDDTGTTVQLMDRPGLPAIQPFGCPNNDVSTFLNDDSTAPIEDACADPDDTDFTPGLSGILAPDGLLEDFDGEDLSGDWTLIIQDAQEGDAGTFNDWCLFVDYEG
jgi:hypothetical protein